MISHHDALIYTMVLASAADNDMTDAELMRIGAIVNHLPVFRDFDKSGIVEAAESCAARLGNEGGLEKVIADIREALPANLRETAYAIACDVVAADDTATQEELRLLEIIRHRLDIDRLVAAGIERGARARHAVR